MPAGSTTVGTAATLILPAQGGRTRAVIINNAGGHDIYVGNDYSVSTMTGFLIANGTTETVNLDGNLPLIGIANGGSSAISWSWAGAGTVGATGATGADGAPGPGNLTVSAQSGAFNAAAGNFYRCDASGGDFNATLPVPTSGSQVIVKNVGASGTVTVLPHAAETIDGAASFPIGVQYQSASFIADGTNWWVI